MSSSERLQKVFVYDRKEVVVLAALAVCVALFAFTLGIHLGKQVAPAPPPGKEAEMPSSPTVGDGVPNRQEIQEQAKDLIDGADLLAEQELREVVQKEGLKLDKPRQVELPKTTTRPQGGKTTVRSASSAQRAGFWIQVGSFPTQKEAEGLATNLSGHGLKPQIREIAPKGSSGEKPKFRVYLTGFKKAQEAEAAGREHLAKKWIEGFIVTRARD